jgi:hypothetical protein
VPWRHILFSPELAGQTITLTSGPYVLKQERHHRCLRRAGLTISGNNTDRVLIVNAGTTASVKAPHHGQWLRLGSGGRRIEQRQA